MNPLKVLTELFRREPSLAVVLLAGLGVFAAAAIVISWKIDIQVASQTGLYILGFAVAVLAVGALGNSPTIRKALGWFFALFIMFSGSAFFISAVFPSQTIVAPPYCLVEFWKKCLSQGGLGDQYAERNFTPVSSPQPIPQQPTVVGIRQSDYRVLVQFAGVIRREDVKAMMLKMRAGGWRVEGADGGGERTPVAAGYNEIRYADPQDEEAARKLAAEVQRANLTPKQITVTRVQGIPAKTLEVWVSRT
jgi:hypothetical protein